MAYTMQRSRNDKLYRSVRNGLIIFTTGATIGAAAATYLMNKESEAMTEEIMKHKAAITQMDEEKRAKADTIAALVEDNSVLLHQNRNFWVELGHQKRRGRYAAKLKQQELLKREDETDNSRIIRSPFPAATHDDADQAEVTDMKRDEAQAATPKKKRSIFSRLFSSTE